MNQTEFDDEILNENIGSCNFVIDKSYTGIRIDKFILNHLKSRPKTQIQHVFKTEKITVNGKSVKKNYILRIGDSVSINSTESEIIPQNTIIKRDDKNCLVSHKIDYELGTKNEELKIIRIHLDSVEKKLQETSDKLLKSEQKLGDEVNKNVLLGKEINKLKQLVDSYKEQIVKINNALQAKEKDIRELQSEKNKENNLLQDKKTRTIGKYDAWNREKFEALQANTQLQFIEYQKMLAYYQNEIDRFRGKKPVEKETSEEKKDEYIIPLEEKTFSAEDYDTWSQEKFEELQENTKRQFLEYDLLLERYKKQLEKYKNLGNKDSLSQTKAENTEFEKTNSVSIKDEITYALSVFWKQLLRKNVKAKYTNKDYRPKELFANSKNKQKIIGGLQIAIILILLIVSIIAIMDFVEYIFNLDLLK
jgi:23S rRNA-/tRNA-specific pseudouridylate synthase